VQGRKRFKRVSTTAAGPADGPNDFNKAKEQYHKLNNRTHYNWQFGERPKASSDHQMDEASLNQLIKFVCKE
jgi:hypothetical protein